LRAERVLLKHVRKDGEKRKKRRCLEGGVGVAEAREKGWGREKKKTMGEEVKER
jgi:hypothetical protein